MCIATSTNPATTTKQLSMYHTDYIQPMSSLLNSCVINKTIVYYRISHSLIQSTVAYQTALCHNLLIYLIIM